MVQVEEMATYRPEGSSECGCMGVSAHIYVWAHKYVYVLYVHVCMYEHVYTCVHICVVCMGVWLCVCCVYMCSVSTIGCRIGSGGYTESCVFIAGISGATS